MNTTRQPRSDALVLFGVTGDLAYKMIFSALYAMAKRGTLNVPVVGVAYSQWSLAQLRERAKASIGKLGRTDDSRALKHHRGLLYKRGSWGPKKADELIKADGSWQNPGADRAAS